MTLSNNRNSLLPAIDNLDGYTEENPFTIVLVAENYADGIGDFVHLYDFYRLLKERFKDDKRVQIRFLCVIDKDKLEIINKIYGQDFKFYEDIDSDPGSEVFINKKHSENDHNNFLKFVEKNKNPALLLRISTWDSRNYSLEGFHPYSDVSLKEYEAANSNTDNEAKYEKTQVHLVKAMGIDRDRPGIKIIKPIIDNKKIFENGGTIACENNYLNQLLEGDFVAAGYLQNKAQSTIFILNCLAMAGDAGTTNILVNHDDYDKINQRLFYSDEMNHYIESYNLSRIEIVSSNGDILFEKNYDNAAQEKILRIVQFKNISEHDKAVIFSSPKIKSIAASGDTSCSEAISAMAFPYIAKKKLFMKSLMDMADREMLGLMGYYFELLIKLDVAINKLIQLDLDKETFEKMLLEEYQKPGSQKTCIANFLLKNIEDNPVQWQELCEVIIKKKNVADFLNNIIDKAIEHDKKYRHLREEKESPRKNM